MIQVTGEQLQQSMKDAGILFVVKDECPLCKTPIVYYRRGDLIFIDNECACNDSDLQQCTWDEVAAWINSHDEITRPFIAHRFGIHL